MDKIYRLTREAYDVNASDFLQKTPKASPPPIDDFIKSLKPKSLVVDLGCGPGRDARKFLEAGMNYFGIDFSPKTIGIARKNNPGINFKVGDFLSLTFRAGSVDAFWAIASLYHLRKDDLRVLMKKLFLALSGGGQIFMVMKKGRSEQLKRDARYQSGYKFVSYYSKKELSKIVRDAGFKFKQCFIVSKKQVHKDTGLKYQDKSIVVIWAYKD